MHDYFTTIWHQRAVSVLGTRDLYLRTVYMHIVGYTNRERGMFKGNIQKLADEIEMDRSTVSKKMDILIGLKLVIKEGDAYRAVQRDNSTVERDNSTKKRDNSTKNVIIAPPPITPSIKEINKERNERKEITRRAQTRTYAKPPPQPYDEGFLSILAAFRLLDSESQQNRTEDQKLRDEQRAWKAWQQHPELHQTATEVVKFGLTKKDDLAFTIEDAMQLQPQIPVPVDYRGQPLGRGIRYYMATYKGERGLYTADDVRRYRMTKPEYFDVP